MSQYVTSQANVGKNRNVKPKTPQLLSQQPVRFDPSGIGKIYNRTGEQILNLQNVLTDRPKMDQNLFSNISGYRGVLPQQPTPYTYQYSRPELDIMGGYQCPAPNARGFKAGSLTDFPILRQLPYNQSTYE